MDATIVAQKDSVGDRSAVRRLAWLLPVVSVAALIARRALQMGDLPTGPDGGTWLAIGRGMLGGPGRDTPGAYAPLVPLATATLANLVGPVDSVRIVGFVAWGVLLAATGFVASRRAGPVVVAAVVVAVGGASTVSEPLFFGGYPQLLAMAAMLMGLWALARWLSSARSWAIAAGSVMLAVAAASHHVYGALAMAGVVAVALLWVVAHRPTVTVIKARLPLVVGALVVNAAVLAPTLLAFRAAGYEPPLDAARFGPIDAWRYAAREAILPWTLVVMVGIAGVVATRRRATPEWLAATGLLLVAGPAMVVSAEPRLVSAVLIASILGVVMVVPTRPPAWCLGTLAAVALALATVGDNAARAYGTFYRVLDQSLIGAATFVEATEPDGLVAVHADRRGWPVGWWYEGLTEQRIAVGSDPRWLGFPNERQQAELVANLFAPGRSGDELRQMADAAGVELLVTGKWDWIGWDRWLSETDPAVVVAYDDDETIVLRILPRDAQRGPATENAGV